MTFTGWLSGPRVDYWCLVLIEIVQTFAQVFETHLGRRFCEICKRPENLQNDSTVRPDFGWIIRDAGGGGGGVKFLADFSEWPIQPLNLSQS